MKLKLLEDVPFYRRTTEKKDGLPVFIYDPSYFLPKGTIIPVEWTEDKTPKEILESLGDNNITIK